MTISRTRRVTTAVIVAITTAAATQLAGASPAGAAPILIHTSTATASSSASVQTISAACPADRRVVGGGAYIDSTDGAYGKVWMTALRPLHTLSGDRFQVTAAETAAGFAGTWWLRAFAVCALPIAGLEIVAATNTAGSAESQQHSAACPAGKKLLGAGGSVNNLSGEVVLQAVGADTVQGTSATVAGHEDPDGYAGSWSLTSYAVCAPPVKRLSIVTGTSSWDNAARKVATATCAAGSDVYAALYSIAAGTGDVGVSTLYPDQTSVVASAHGTDGSKLNWSLTAIAVCA